MRIMVRCLSIVLLLLLVIFARQASDLEAGEIFYYDKNGSIISKEKYLELTGQKRKSNQTQAAPAAEKTAGSDEVPTVEEGPKPPAEKTAGTDEAPTVEEEPKSKSPRQEAEPSAEKPAKPETTPPAGEEFKTKRPEQTEEPAAEKPSEPVKTPAAKEEPKAKSPSKEALPDAAGLSEDKQAADEEEGVGPQYQASISSGTLFRAFQRNTAKKEDALVTPAYEYLRIDFGALDQGGLSLHMYGWGRYDFSDSGFYKENPDGEVLYGYIEYARPEYGFNLKLGRQHSFEGVINNSIDGLGVKSALTPYFALSLYGGSPVELESEEGRSGDSFLGGRFSARLNPKYEIGLSYKQKYSQGDEDEKITGIDLFAALPGNVSLQGLSAYNLQTRGWGEHTYEAGFDIADFHVRPLYQRYQYKDFFNTGDNSADPFRFLSDTGEILTVVGGEVLWRGLTAVDVGAKVKHYTYDLRNDSALYYEGNLTWYIDGRTQIGGQLGRMDGESAETCYLLSRAFFYWHTPFGLVPLGFITGDAVYVHYDEELFGKNRSLFISLGSGLHFLDDALEVKLSGDYSDDPYFDSDLRGLLVVTYKY